MNAKTATYVKTHFGECINDANNEPIIIETHGKKNAVMLSYNMYLLLQTYEDYYWGEKAKAALNNNAFLSSEDSINYLKSKI